MTAPKCRPRSRREATLDQNGRSHCIPAPPARRPNRDASRRDVLPPTLSGLRERDVDWGRPLTSPAPSHSLPMAAPASAGGAIAWSQHRHFEDVRNPRVATRSTRWLVPWPCPAQIHSFEGSPNPHGDLAGVHHQAGAQRPRLPRAPGNPRSAEGRTGRWEEGTTRQSAQVESEPEAEGRIQKALILRRSEGSPGEQREGAGTPGERGSGAAGRQRHVSVESAGG